MSFYILVPIVTILSIVACFLWDFLIDGTFRHEPSAWLGYAYLWLIAMLLSYASKYLGEIVVHPYRSAVIVFGGLALIGASAIPMWRKAAKWDKEYHNRHRHS